MDWKEGEEPLRKAIEQRKSFLQLAMYDGLKVGLLFMAQAIALLLYQLGSLSSLLLLASIIGVPVMLYILGVRFRDHQMGGSIRYIHIVSYLSWTYIFAIGIGFLSYFIATTLLFKDPTFVETMEKSFEIVTEIVQQNMAQDGEAMASLRNITPVRVSGAIAMQALFNGLIYIYIIGLVIKKSNR